MKQIAVLLMVLAIAILPAQPPLLSISDKPNDDGSALIISWDCTDVAGETFFVSYRDAGDVQQDITTFTPADNAYPTGSLIFRENLHPGTTYHFSLDAADSTGVRRVVTQQDATPVAQWFNTDKISLLIMALILAVAIVFYIYSAKSGKDLYIRRINGLEAMEESVGRATEMGKPILFVPGINDLDDMQTIAGLTILGQLAYKAAEHDTPLLVPVSRSMVLSTAREIVKEAFLKAGRPDAYNPDCVFYLTDDQFGYVAGVDGIIVREKPAANFYLGAFYAESLILAETGFSSGAIQTAGTAMPSQIPFFVAACDYTLIGEELFAASAYLSKEPHQLGSLKGQDVGKAVFLIVLIIGIVLEIFGVHGLKDFLTVH
jgi:hypothetical protein